MLISEPKEIKDIINDKSETRVLSFIQKKSQRILKACYIITETVKDSEPLRSEIRNQSHRFLKDINSLVVGIPGTNAESARRACGTLYVVEGLLEAGVIASFWTTEVGSLVRAEVAQLASLIERRFVRPILLQEPVSRDFFTVEMPLEAVREMPSRRPDTTSEKRLERPPVPHSASVIRQETIIKSIGRLGTATIRDIITESRFLEETSEKTIQRELLSLISGGRITRQGERRWSRYSLVSEASLSAH